MLLLVAALGVSVVVLMSAAAADRAPEPPPVGGLGACLVRAFVGSRVPFMVGGLRGVGALLVSVFVLAAMLVVVPNEEAEAAGEVTVTLRVRGCAGCRMTVETGEHTLTQRRLRDGWQRIRFAVPAGQRLHVEVVKRGVSRAAVPQVVWRYRGFDPGERVTLKKVRRTNPGAGFVCSPRVRTDAVYKVVVHNVPTRRYPGWRSDPLRSRRTLVAFVTPTASGAATRVSAAAKRFRTPGAIAVQNVVRCR